MKVFLLALGLLGLAIAGIAIKMFFIKGGMFTKQCSSVDTGDVKLGCTCGEKSPEERCENYEKHHGKGYDAARKISTLDLKI